MRIISGLCRGRKLKAVKGLRTRPTADRVKEAVFNILANKVVHTKVLDLFAGTGNIGLEALSRGADLVTFVEKDRQALNVLKTNIESCGFQEQADILFMDALKALKVLKAKDEKFDIIYLDPPYRLNTINDIINSIINYSLVKQNCIIIVETSKSSDINSNFGQLVKVREDIYGDTKITYLQ